MVTRTNKPTELKEQEKDSGLLIMQLCLYVNDSSPGVVTGKVVVFEETGGSLKSVKSK